MRSTVALLAALLVPACLSGFSEIRVQGPDAGVSDRALPSDTQGADAVTRDAPGDRAPALDVVPEDAPAAIDAAPSTDLGTLDAAEADVVDAAGPDVLAVDAVDVLEDRPVQVDAGAIVDAPAAPDVVDAGTCPGGCLAGEACEGGRCGRWVYAVPESTGDVDYSNPNALEGVEARCRARLGNQGRLGRVCRVADVPGVNLGELCRSQSAGGFVLGDPDAVAFRADRGWYVPGCVRCLTDAATPPVSGGAACGFFWSDTLCCGFVPR